MMTDEDKLYRLAVPVFLKWAGCSDQRPVDAFGGTMTGFEMVANELFGIPSEEFRKRILVRANNTIIHKLNHGEELLV